MNDRLNEKLKKRNEKTKRTAFLFFRQLVELKVEHFVNFHEHENDINMCSLDFPNWTSHELQHTQQEEHFEAKKQKNTKNRRKFFENKPVV